MSNLSVKGKRWLGPTLDLQSMTNAEDIANALAKNRGLLLNDDASLPWTFPDLARAMERVDRAIQNKEVVGIFGDYDCDGVTGTALVLRLLRLLGVRPIVRLPHRIREGYGLKQLHVEEMQRQHVTLLITVDTGIGCKAEVQYAQEHGCDVIVLDHHHVPPAPAEPYAVLHPALAPNWHGSHPAAAGVAWAFVTAIKDAKGITEGRDEDLLLGSWGTIGDVVPLRERNRTLVQQGLAACARVTSGPLAELLAQADCSGSPTARDIAFRIAPRLNAAGRMADPMIALKAILGDAPSMQSLEQLNSQRQATVQQHWGKALNSMDCNAPFLFLTSEEYTPGIVGLLAGKLTEMFGKPSLVASIQGEQCTASLRSVPLFDVTAALQRHAEFFTSFGGHAQAAGCTFTREKSGELHRALCDDVSSRLSAEDLVPTMTIDALLAPQQLTTELLNALRALEPHGQGNDQPRFLLSNVQLQDVRLVGQDRTHLQARCGNVKVIGFGLGQIADSLNAPCNMVGQLSTNEWQGKTSLQLMVEDMKIEKIRDTNEKIKDKRFESV